MMHKRKPTENKVKATKNWGVWSKEPSKFPWYYDEKETCYILEGEATVTDNNGNKISFGPGDMVEFEKGLECTWEISSFLKKRFMLGE